MNDLVRYDEARRALQQAATVDEAKDIRDKAAALAAYARQRNDVEMEKWVAEIKLRATVRIGEISAALEKSPSGPGRGKKSLPANGKPFKSAVLKNAGISTSAAHRAEKLAAHKTEVENYIRKTAAAGRPVKFTEVLVAIERQARDDECAAKFHTPYPFDAESLVEGRPVQVKRHKPGQWTVALGANISRTRYEEIVGPIRSRSEHLAMLADAEAAEKEAALLESTAKKMRKLAAALRRDLDRCISEQAEAEHGPLHTGGSYLFFRIDPARDAEIAGLPHDQAYKALVGLEAAP